MPVGAVLIQQYNNCTQTAIGECMTEAALFELLSLECLIDSDGNVHYHNAQGEFHRIYGPAVEYSSGSRDWYQNGQLHRLDGPAFECPEGHRAWYKDGQRHRPDGPAVEWTNGYRAWYQNGQRHRLDGPAIVYPSGRREWWLNGKELTEAEWQQQVASMEIYA